MAGRNDVMVARTVYQMAIVTVVAALLWVGWGIYQAAQGEVVIEVDKAMLEPLSPIVDQGVLGQLEARYTTNSPSEVVEPAASEEPATVNEIGSPEDGESQQVSEESATGSGTIEGEVRP